MASPRDLVLLDVDGVVNWLNVRAKISLISHGYKLRLPAYMPDLIVAMVASAEVWWCSTWRLRANDDLGPFLGIPALPAIDREHAASAVDWKPLAAAALVEAAVGARRHVWWFEDFDAVWPAPSHPPYDSPLVTCVNTTLTGKVLLPSSVPEHLRGSVPESLMPAAGGGVRKVRST